MTEAQTLELLDEVLFELRNTTAEEADPMLDQWVRVVAKQLKLPVPTLAEQRAISALAYEQLAASEPS
jgi:hypothetical protein